VFDEEISTSNPMLEHTLNIEILYSNKGFDVEISASNKPPR